MEQKDGDDDRLVWMVVDTSKVRRVMEGIMREKLPSFPVLPLSAYDPMEQIMAPAGYGSKAAMPRLRLYLKETRQDQHMNEPAVETIKWEKVKTRTPEERWEIISTVTEPEKFRERVLEAMKKSEEDWRGSRIEERIRQQLIWGTSRKLKSRCCRCVKSL